MHHPKKAASGLPPGTQASANTRAADEASGALQDKRSLPDTMRFERCDNFNNDHLCRLALSVLPPWVQVRSTVA